MVAFIDDNLSVLPDQVGNRIVFLIDQALVGSNVDLTGRFLFATANHADGRTLNEGFQTLLPLIK